MVNQTFAFTATSSTYTLKVGSTTLTSGSFSGFAQVYFYYIKP
jgi:hypothetical protein